MEFEGKLIKIDAKAVSRGRYVAFQMVEVDPIASSARIKCDTGTSI